MFKQNKETECFFKSLRRDILKKSNDTIEFSTIFSRESGYTFAIYVWGGKNGLDLLFSENHENFSNAVFRVYELLRAD